MAQNAFYVKTKVYTECPKKNGPTLKYNIVKNIKFDIFKLSTVI